MKKTISFLAGIICFSSFGQISSAVVKPYVVDAWASVTNNPPSVTISWVASTPANSVKIRRKAKDDGSWTTFTLDKTANSYIDNAVQSGKIYEYVIVRNLPVLDNADASQSLSVGIDLPVIDYRGKIILLVESAAASVLKSEIDRLILDMICDGWQVQQINVPATETVPNAKTIIKNAYLADPNNIKALFLLGHIPVPYSGNLCPDGHSDHYGAYPADCYYADMDGVWTDKTVNNSVAAEDPNHNIPGDGKFDQSVLPSEVELQVSRVDFNNMPMFQDYDVKATEMELLRRYLNKDHAFRTRKFYALRKGLIEDQFVPRTFAISGWSNLMLQLGTSNLREAGFRDNIQNHYLWAYVCGGGNPYRAGTAITSADFADRHLFFNYVFTMMYGSYFGDWNHADNLMRAALASKGSVLTCSWSGLPVWSYRFMGNGDNIGYCVKNQQNDISSPRSVYISLLGDPILRQHIVAPPQTISDKVINNQVVLKWTSSPDKVLGYYVYKANNINSVFSRITATLITDTTYTDAAAVSGNYIYIVKAVQFEKNNCGTYYNTSRGILISNISGVKDADISIHHPRVWQPVPDTFLPERTRYTYAFDKTFTDPDTGDVFTYSITMAGKNQLAAGWKYTVTSNTLSASSPLNGVYTFVITVTDMQLYESRDTFMVTIGNFPLEKNPVENPDTRIALYPNPASEYLTIDVPEGIYNRYMVCDITGRIVEQNELNGNKQTISVSVYSKGAYVLTLYGKDKLDKYKFIVE